MKTGKKPNTISIDKEINSIFENLKSAVSANTVVVREKAPRGASCHGVISFYNADELKRQADDSSYNAIPVERYVFYPSTYCPNRLGSVAIYGRNAVAHYAILRRRATLFGYPIRDAQLESGRRPFIDVTLVA